MINHLTPEQEAKLPEYRDKWLKIGTCTEPANRPEAEKAVREMYRCGGLTPPEKIVWCSSPLAMFLTVKIVKASVRDSVRSSVGNSVGDSVGDSVWNSVRASIWASVWDSVRDSVRDSVGDSVYGQHEAHWLGFYDYFREVVGLKEETEKLTGLLNLAKNAGWIYPTEDICYVSERHNVCKLKNGVVHCEDGPAIQYPDGFSVWALNGVRVPQEIVETPANQLDPELILTEKNAEVRREIVRKIGIERVIKKLKARTLDKWKVTSTFWSAGNAGMEVIHEDTEYELLEIKIPNMSNPAKYLKMKNPSIGVWHVEGVPPDIKTCREALSWRVGGIEWNPEQLT